MGNPERWKNGEIFLSTFLSSGLQGLGQICSLIKWLLLWSVSSSADVEQMCPGVVAFHSTAPAVWQEPRLSTAAEQGKERGSPQYKADGSHLSPNTRGTWTWALLDGLCHVPERATSPSWHVLTHLGEDELSMSFFHRKMRNTKSCGEHLRSEGWSQACS